MNYLLATLATILASESIFHLPFSKSVKASTATARKSASVIRSPNISDHWKERVVLKYAAVLLTETLKITLMITALLAIIASVVLAGHMLQQDTMAFLMTMQGLATVTAASAAYLFLRTRLA